MLATVCFFSFPIVCRDAESCCSPAGCWWGEGLFACFLQVSLLLSPSPSHTAVTKWALHTLLFCSTSSSCCPCKPEAVPSHSAAVGLPSHCSDTCCCLHTSLSAGEDAFSMLLCLCKPVQMPCAGRPGAVRPLGAQRGCAADGTLVFPVSYCLGFC